MSVSIITPCVGTDFYRLKTRKALKPHKPDTRPVAKIKKNLFGTVDRDANKRFVATELAKQAKVASEKWGFDFLAGVPLDNQTDFEWTCTISAAGLTLTQSAHSLDTDNEHEDLLDERAEKSNFHVHCDSSPSSGTRTGRSCYHLRKLPSNHAKIEDKRQPKITDFLKEKKKSVVSPAAKKTTTVTLNKSRSTISSTSANPMRLTFSQ